MPLLHFYLKNCEELLSWNQYVLPHNVYRIKPSIPLRAFAHKLFSFPGELPKMQWSVKMMSPGPVPVVRGLQPKCPTVGGRAESGFLHFNPRNSISITNTKGLLNMPGQNNCFLNSAVQVSVFIISHSNSWNLKNEKYAVISPKPIFSCKINVFVATNNVSISNFVVDLIGTF